MKHWVTTSGNTFTSQWNGEAYSVPEPPRGVFADAPSGPVSVLPTGQQAALAWLARGLRDVGFYAGFKKL